MNDTPIDGPVDRLAYSAEARHIAIVVQGFGGTGAVAQVALNHARQMSRWYRVSVVSDSQPSDPSETWVPIMYHAPRFDWMRRLSHVPNQISVLVAAFQALKRLHARDRLDLVWCHSHAMAAWPLARFHGQYGVPFGMTVHGDIFERPPGTYDPLLTRLYKSATPRAYRRASFVHILAPVWEPHVLRWGVRKDDILVVPNGIRRSDFLPYDEVESCQGRPLRVLFVGRLSVEKGVRSLLEAVELLRSKGLRFEVDIVGGGPEADSLRAFVRDRDLDNQVKFWGMVPRRSLGKIYAAADIVCVPSLSEPLGIVVLEALVHGTPVLATNVGGIPYIIEDGRNGWLVPPGDPGAMAEKIERLIHNPEECRAMADAARCSVEERFSWDRIGEQLAVGISDYLVDSVR